jgi:D-glycero-D-manno-heptose 1,7-bisphosphate phosphatase
MIGDKESDIEAALAAGVQKTVLVRSGHKIDEKNTKATFVVNGIFDTIRIVTDFAH